MTEKKKVKRVLFNFDFDSEGAHVALVSKKQGGPANGVPVLVTKSLHNGIQPTDTVAVSKALEQITVTLSFEDFLRKFFGLYYDDAETLTKLLGFQTEHEAREESRSEEEDEWDYESYLASKISKFTLMKSLHDNLLSSPNQTIADDDFIEITKMQHSIEHLLLQQKEETNMVNSTTIVIEKSRFSELETKEAELTVAVQKAADLQSEVETLKAQISKAVEDKEALELDAFTSRLKDLVADAELEKVSKSLFNMNKVDAESVEAIIATFEAKKAALEKSDLFEEKSHEEQIDPETKKVQAMKSLLNAPYESI